MCFPPFKKKEEKKGEKEVPIENTRVSKANIETVKSVDFKSRNLRQIKRDLEEQKRKKGPSYIFKK